MKLYVVTEGVYSDYHIVCIFSDKSKAENYVKYHAADSYFDGLNIEEYELEDDKYVPITSGYHNLYAHCKIDLNNIINTVKVRYDGLSVEDKSDDCFRFRKSDRELELSMTLCFKDDITEEQAKEKAKKILCDTASQVCYYRSQRYSVDDIKEALNL